MAVDWGLDPMGGRGRGRVGEADADAADERCGPSSSSQSPKIQTFPLTLPSPVGESVYLIISVSRSSLTRPFTRSPTTNRINQGQNTISNWWDGKDLSLSLSLFPSFPSPSFSLRTLSQLPSPDDRPPRTDENVTAGRREWELDRVMSHVPFLLLLPLHLHRFPLHRPPLLPRGNLQAAGAASSFPLLP